MTDAAARQTILTWNFPNWVTVVLMVVIGFFAVGAIAGAARKFSSGDEASA